jgi:L,D-transpeptidase YbiS
MLWLERHPFCHGRWRPAGSTAEPHDSWSLEHVFRPVWYEAGLHRSPARRAVRTIPGPAARFLPAGEDPYLVRKTFRISTSRLGTGQHADSNQTPLGLHRIAAKIGAGCPSGTVFESRRPVGLIWRDRATGAIAHRILWLEGLEPGYNRGGNVDSLHRYIYIHGLANEPSLGRPASRGCIHLAAADLIPLFDRLPVGTLVWVTKG